ncbi:MAG: molybdopterin-dependent oxidoreductase [Coriobacteriia bacterium]|nr:molybdopterin-dependent oxidoreductase [Coriobacteriia bacterium]
MSDTTPSLSRRSFVKTTGALGALAAAGGTLAASEQLFGNVPLAMADEEEAVPETIAWSQCNVNCGGNCVFQWHSVDGKVQYMETDNTGDDPNFQARACLRGRSMRKWLNHPDRLLYPMKRVGKRGEGKFEQITWEEATDLIAEKLKWVYSEYGPEAIHINYATGMYSSMGKPGNRLLALLGGYLNQGADYSTHMLQVVMPYMFGWDGEKGNVFSPYDNVNASSFTEAEAHSDLVVMFGNSPAETRMGGINAVWDFNNVREAVEGRGGKIIHIDYRLNETASGTTDDWIPIRTGTDAALCAALVHEFIQDGKTDEDFLAKYTVGWDESTMPKAYQGKNMSYKAYVMGQGYDMVEKTPEWAAEITQIPADRIRQLAKELEDAKAPFVVQGWGPQRHTNGETATRAICMVPIALGKFGLPGTNTGQREAEPPAYLVGSIAGSVANPCTATIPVYNYLNGIDHGHELTAENGGITGADKLPYDIKFLWNYAGNCLTNQHGDINYAHEVLSDESKCEFILVWDTVMTDSAKYADLLLPDAMRSEQLNMQTQGYSEYYTGVTVGGPAQEPPGECRSSYDVCAEIAQKMGIGDKFTEGKTHDQWIEEMYKAGQAAAVEAGYKDMPTWEGILEQGVYKVKCEPSIGLKAFRDDPEANPLGTPSGKIEVFSETLQNLNKTWELGEDEVIYPIPLFDPGFEGYGSTTAEFPLYCSGFHHKSRTHSSFGFIEELKDVARQQLWINPADAEPRGIANGDMCAVKSPAGEIRIEAKVTPRIIPGTVAVPQGSWHDANMDGDKVDHGACINTLTTYKPTPLAKGNGPSNSIIVQVAKA